MQKLISTYQPRLKELANHFQHVSCSFDDPALSKALESLLVKLGFTVNPLSNHKKASLVSNITQWLKDGHLVLLNYKRKADNSTLLGILRAIKKVDKRISFQNLIPMLIMPSATKSQLESYRLLSTFDIQYVSSLSHDSRIAASLEEILSDLTNFSDLIKKDFAVKPKILTEEPSSEIEKVKEYKSLLSKGQSLMEEGSYEKAIDSFTNAIEINRSFELLVDRGDAYYKIAKYVKALYDYREANKLEQSLPEPYTKIGTCCFALVKGNAKNNKNELVDKWFTLGMKHFYLAGKVTTQMINENKDRPERLPDVPYAPIANALIGCDIRGLKLDEMEKQLSKLTLKVLEKTKSVDYLSSDIDIDLRIDHAILLTRTKNYEKAEKIFRQIIKDDPSMVGPAFNNFAVELRKNGCDEKAFNILREIMDYDIPDKKIVVENLKTAGAKYATNLRKNSKHKEAIGIYKIILQNNPLEKEWVLCELAEAHMELKNKEEASSRLMEAVRVNPQLMKQVKFKRYPGLNSLRIG